jgi:phosphoglycolate phosphatase
MLDLVHDLQQKGIRLAVASNKYHEAVVHLVKHFFPDVEWAVIAGQKEGVPTKPDPSIVFDILTCAPTPKAQVLYVGDSAVDMETARRACVESVGVTWGFRPVAELKAAYADHIVNNPAEILPLALSSMFE